MQEGCGLRHIMTGLEAERINVAARGVGLARAALEEAVRYARVRRTFGKPIAEHQAIQMMLADMATKIEAARQLTRFAAEKKDRGEKLTDEEQKMLDEAIRQHEQGVAKKPKGS